MYAGKYFEFDRAKNEWLVATRGVGFEQIIEAIRGGGIIMDYPHPDQQKYPGQKIYEILLDNYVYQVPYIQDQQKHFLKTIIPSRKATARWRRDGQR